MLTHGARFASCILALALAVAGLASADIPKVINYQGLLADKDTGDPLSGTYTLTFSLYGQLSGGTPLWSETKDVTTDESGVFSTLLGSASPINLIFDTPCWLEIQVNGETLAPRRELASVPYAFHAMNADSLGGLTSASFALSGHLHDDVYVNEGQANSITSAMIAAGQIANEDISASAAIDPAKVSGTAWTSANDGASSGLDADLLDGQHAGAFAGAAHQHDDRYYTESELNTGDGSVNQAGDPVDWTKLKSVPGGFADGADNVGSADGHSLDAADGSPTDVVYVAADGYVGIGTLTPSLGRLTVLGSAEPAICGSAVNGAGVYGFSDSGNGILGASNNGKAGAFAGEVYASGRVDSDSGFSIDGETRLSVPGKNNLFIGRFSGDFRAAPERNTCVGDSTGCAWMSSDNTFLGYKAGSANQAGYGSLGAASHVLNERNVFVGAYAGYKNYSRDNVCIGFEAGHENAGGLYNTFVGSLAGQQTTAGDANVFLGASAGLTNVTGTSNVYCGTSAGSLRENGSSNTYLGNQAGGSGTVGMGETGDNNTALGCRAGYEADGSGNVFLGYEAGYGFAAVNKLIIANGRDPEDILIYGNFETGNIGLGTTGPERKLHILGDGPRILIESRSGNPELNFENTDDTSVERWAIYKHSSEDDLRFYQNGDRVTFEGGTGNVAIGATDAAGYRLCVNGSVFASTGYFSSDARLKTDLLGIDDALGKIMRLNGMSFRWRTEDYTDRGFPQGRHYGLVAQEVEEVLPEVVGSGLDGEKALAYSELIPVLVEAVKELKTENDALRARIDALENRGTHY